MSLTELVISKANAEDCKDVALMDKWQSNLESLSAFDNDWDFLEKFLQSENE